MGFLKRLLYGFSLLLIATLSSFAFVYAQDSFQCNYTTDLDQDNDGLIEICDLDALNAIRYQLDGSGYREGFEAEKITAGCPDNNCTGYELRRDLDFATTQSYINVENKAAWTRSSGWQPIGDRLNFFNATFEGNGHKISNLFINSASDYVALFKTAGEQAKISGLVLSQIDVKGKSFVSGLVAYNEGAVSYIKVNGGRLAAAGNNAGALVGANEGTILNGEAILESVAGNGHSIGGLVGYNNGYITYSFAESDLSGVSQVGGLVGFNSGGILGNNEADGTIKGSNYIGGLVGSNSGHINANHASSDVTSDGSYIGGLVGANHRGGRISGSRVSGSVSGNLYVGGLVGANHRGGRISGSQASGSVSGNLYVGGLVGWNVRGRIINSFATNRVEGNSDVGGLTGWNENGRIANTYTGGFVSGVHRIGGLVGNNKGIISNSFTNRRVVGSGEDIGGLIGWNYAHRTRNTTTVQVIHSYWDSVAGEISTSDGGSARTTAQLKSPTAPGVLGETFERWDTDDWDFGTNQQYPILKHAEGLARGRLLSGQSAATVSGLLVLEGLTLSPVFNPQVLDYRVKVNDDALREITLRPIVNDSIFISLVKDASISLPPLRSGSAASIALNAAPEPTLITVARQYRIWVIRRSGMEAAIVPKQQGDRINEGQRIAFDVSVSEPDTKRVRYSWSQLLPPQPNLLEGLNTRQSQLNIAIPDDFIAKSTSDTIVVLRVEVSNGETTIARTTTMTVVKVDNGSLGLATPAYDEGILIAAEVSDADLLIDSDGGADMRSFRYQWQYKLPTAAARWHDIKDATQKRYEIPINWLASDNIRYRVRLAYRDGQGHRHRVVSESIAVMGRVLADDDFVDINYLEDLDAIRRRPERNYELVRDLDFNDNASYRDFANKNSWTVNNYSSSQDVGWQPLGSSSNRFAGTFKGNGYTISNLQINRDATYQGLFGYVGAGAVLNDISLLNVKIEGGAFVGGLAGDNSGTIVGANVIGEVSGYRSIGGLVGDNKGRVINSYADVTISAQSSDSINLGGLVGTNSTNNAVVLNSHATAEVVLIDSTDYAGGLVGWQGSGARIINSYATAKIRGVGDYVGGLVGHSEGYIDNSYAAGSIQVCTFLHNSICVFVGSHFGGLIGTNSGNLRYSYSIASVQGAGNNVSRLVGLNSGLITASYWDKDISGAQGNDGSAQTTQQMQLPTAAIGIYDDWDDASWDFGNRQQYPILKYAPGPAKDACDLPGMPQCGDLISPGFRYGLRDLAVAKGTVSPAFDIDNLNRIGVYVGSRTDNTIQLIPTAMESTANISVYIEDSKTPYDSIQSGDTTKEILLQENNVNRIVVEVEGTKTVRYSLYISYHNTDDDRFTPIYYLEDLDAISGYPQRNYKLVRDLDFNDDTSYRDPINKIIWTVDDYEDGTDTGWLPIGRRVINRFDGNFDGQGYTISNLQINRGSSINQSLFGITRLNSVISNVGLLNVKVEGGLRPAGLISRNFGKVSNSYVTGSIRAMDEGPSGGLVASHEAGAIIGSYAIVEVSGKQQVGGIAGYSQSPIINSYADVMISVQATDQQSYGGLVGSNQGPIINSHAVGEISAPNSFYAGGLAGWNAQDALIINSYAAVNVEAEINAGGLVGINQGSINNSYAMGNVVGVGNNRGGLVGENAKRIINSYSIGNVQGAGSNVGGLVGGNTGSGSITASYWNSQTSNAQGNNGRGQTTSELQSPIAATDIYADWSTTHWDFGSEGQYPILKYVQNPDVSGERACGSSELPKCGNLISPRLRYGLRDLMTANSVALSVPFDIQKHNHRGVYFGTITNDDRAVRLIPIAMESTARISIIGVDRETIDSGETSAPIVLKEDGVTEIIVEVKGTKTARYTLYLNYAYHQVIDEDRDSLIDINYLEDLDAIRNQLDSSGYRADSDALKITVGCPLSRCKGYELLRDLDFNDPGSYRDAAANMRKWTGEGAWQPIALGSGTFTGIFKGNNKTIANLKVRESGGLFASVGSDSHRAQIDGLGLLGVDIKGNNVAGISTACLQCEISNSYVIGNIEGEVGEGGLVSNIGTMNANNVSISNSYFIGNLVVNGQSGVGGGLIADAGSDVTITDSYVVGIITKEEDGGFIGSIIGSRTSGGLRIENNYASVFATKAGVPQGLFGGNVNPSDKSAPTINTSYLDKDIAQVEITVGEIKSTVDLQSPITATGIYMDWDDANWEFGTAHQYPAIKYNLSMDPAGNGEYCDATDIQKRPDACRTILRHQGSLLQSLELTEGAGWAQAFDFAIFNYDVSVNADRSTIRLLPTAFNPNVTIEISKDGNIVGETASGSLSQGVILNDAGDTIISLVVKDGIRSSYRYQFRVNRLDIVAENIDKDDDGLIEINNVMQLNAIRHRLDGTAYKESEIASEIYCSKVCNGYELVADLDLAGIDWQPIGDSDNPFNSIFKGNGHTIFNLNINATDITGTVHVGLFAANGVQARIENIALVNVNIKDGNYVGSLAGFNQGLIVNSYASGNIVASDRAGGLVGLNNGPIRNSYARVDVQSREGGGLVWSNQGLIVNSYASGNIEATDLAGGLIGNGNFSVTSSYAVGNVKAGSRVGGLTGRAQIRPIRSYYNSSAIISGPIPALGSPSPDRTEQELKQGVPSGNIYTNWSRTNWHFGTTDQYPALLYAAVDTNSPACKRPSVQQLSDCNTRLSPNLSEHDKAVICRSHLQRAQEDLPYCGALLDGQRSGIIQLDFSKNARLVQTFNPDRFEYSLLVDPGTDIYTTATAYYGSDEITIVAGNLNVSVGSGKQSPLITISGLSSMIFEVKSEAGRVTKRYTIDVYDIAVEDDFIMINHLEDLNLMRIGREEISAITKACRRIFFTSSNHCRYKLARDLDFNDPDSYQTGVVNPVWTTGAGWQPIGVGGEKFIDRFIGNGYTISNLRIHNFSTGHAGLFNVIDSAAEIENIGLLNVDISTDDKTGSFGTGALVGSSAKGGRITNSYVIGGSVRGNSHVGGLVGLFEGTIYYSYTDVLVSATGAFSGGLVGNNAGSPSIYNSYARGDVSGGDSVGGLAGFSTGMIYNSYASSMVKGDSKVGGLVGEVNKHRQQAHGTAMNVNDSYAIGKVSGKSSTGGLIGEIGAGRDEDRSKGEVNRSYWDTQTSGREASAGGAGKTTSALQVPVGATGIYSNWSPDDWHFGTNAQYPALKYRSLTFPVCREANDVSSRLPICGTLLPGQRTGLINLARSTDQVLALNPAFNSAIFNYDMILRSDVMQFVIIPWAFNPGATIVIDDDSGTNLRRTLTSGQSTSLSIGNSDSIELTLAVTEPSGITMYRLAVSRHPFIDVNDIDNDDDGLIEILNLEGLDAIRYQLDGSGYRAGPSDIKITRGCPTTPTVGCKGYELAQDIDFNDNARITNWQPIGSIVRGVDGLADCNHQNSACFSAIFEGNGFTISKLVIDRADADHVALFAALADSAQIKNLNLSNAEIRGRSDVGSITAHNAGVIANSHVSGTVAGDNMVGGLAAYNARDIANSYVSGTVAGDNMVGGLAAYNAGDIRNSYALNRVLGDNGVGGLVGLNFGTIKNTYATGIAEANARIGGLVGENGGLISDSYAVADIVCTDVSVCENYASDAGGLIGRNLGRDAINSYWDIEVSGIRESAGGLGKTSKQLQSGSNQSSDASGVYYEWDTADWHFGTSEQYPILKYTTGTESVRACGAEGQPNCGTLQSYGLANLAIAEVATISPNFNTVRLHYQVGVESGANIKQLHLIPSALNEEAVISIVSDTGFEATVASGTSSSAIALNSTGTTVIIVGVAGDRSVKYRLEVGYFSSALAREVDTDGNELIEIRTLEDLDAIRNALDGRYHRHQGSDGMFVESSKGCPVTGCKGYELIKDLDFNDPDSYRSGRVQRAWTTGAGWQPIGSSAYPFTAIFEGNGFTISNLRINRTGDAGLFGVMDGSSHDARIEQLGLLNVDIVGGGRAGSLVAYNRAGAISESYATGYVTANGHNSSAIAGGLVGRNDAGSISASYAAVQLRSNLSDRLMSAFAGGLVAINDKRSRVENSYAIGSVVGQDNVGALVASNRGSSRITNSYAVSRLVGIGANPKIGGLVAINSATIANSYWDIEASGITESAGGTSSTTVVLQSSTPASPRDSIYAAWDPNIWDFANVNRYPALRATTNTSLFNPKGKSLLQSLSLSGNVRLFPSFHPLIFDYDLIAEAEQATQVQLETTPTRANAIINIDCSDGLMCSSGTPASFVLDGINAPEITITVSTPDNEKLQYKLSVYYAEIEIKRMTASTATIVSSPLAVDEGERLNLIASYNFNLNEDSYRYTWQQLGGNTLKFNDTLQRVRTNQARLDFTVPADVAAKDKERSVAQLIVEAGIGEDLHISKVVPLIIRKLNNDMSNRIRLMKSSGKANTYSVRFERNDRSAAADNDGGFAEDFSFPDVRWQRRSSEEMDWITVGNGFPYTIPNEGDYQYRALASYEDGQGYSQSLISGIIDFADIDDDNDGLIEIRYLEELDAIRHQLDGSGYRESAGTALNTTGCPTTGCIGYELVNDLDFDNDASYSNVVNKARWTVINFSDADDSSWQPIDAAGSKPFSAVFKGNGFKISNLQINRSVNEKNNIGLFARIGAGGRVEGLTLKDVLIGGLEVSSDVTRNVGGIAGVTWPDGVIVNSSVVTSDPDNFRVAGGKNGFVGGIVGLHRGYILNSYTSITVHDTGENVGKNTSVGGIAGRNSNSGKIHNSYAAGNVKGACAVGGLVGSQYTTNADSTSEIRNSYVSSEVATGFGNCSQRSIVGGIVGSNTSSIIENTYMSGVIRSLADTDNCIPDTNAAFRGTALASVIDSSEGAPIRRPPLYSYWNSEAFDASCRVSGSETYEIYYDSYSRSLAMMQNPTKPNVSSGNCFRLLSGRPVSDQACTTYRRWSTDDWDFGTSSQYPAIKYGVGQDANNPACGTGELPDCNHILLGQIPNALLLDSLSLSVNSRQVQLSSIFKPDRFNYEVFVEVEVLPANVKIAASAADRGTQITFHGSDGTPLAKQPDGSVQISTNTSFNFGIKTAKGNNRGASYRVQVHLKYLPQLSISQVLNGGVSSELDKNIIVLDEGDSLKLDASMSSAQENARLDYRWSQVSGIPLLPEAVTTATLEFTVPADFIARDRGHNTGILKLELNESNNPTVVVSREISLSVNKINNGDLESRARWISNETLSAVDLSSDADGDPTDISYAWSIERNGRFLAIPGAKQKTYTPRANSRNAQYRLSISYTDRQGYKTNIYDDAPRFSEIAGHRDKDGNGLIEIENLEGLNAIRYQLDGSGYKASLTASKITAGCPVIGCKGYELVKNLDFFDNASYSSTSNKVIWTTGEGWQPIGNIRNPFTAIFDGNGYTITNLRIHRRNTDNIGLFSIVDGTDAEIRGVGLINAFVEGRNQVGGLVGDFTQGLKIANSYVRGTVEGVLNVGGLVGWTNSDIENSYAIGNVNASSGGIGGLVGFSSYVGRISRISNSYAACIVRSSGNNVGGLVGSAGSHIDNSYARGDVLGANFVGGLVGDANGEISDSFSVGKVSGSSAGGLVGRGNVVINRSYWRIDADNPIDSHNSTATNLNYKGFTSADLKSPTVSSTKVGTPYYKWSAEHWAFGTSEHYPAVQYHDDSCNTAMPSPDCSKLLHHQHMGLRDISLEQNIGLGQVYLSPNFSSTTTLYAVTVHGDATELKITPIAVNPDARIIADGRVVSADDGSYRVAIDFSMPTSTVIWVSAGQEEPIEYKLIVNNRSPLLVINAPEIVGEDRVVKLNALIEDSDGDELSYSLIFASDLLPDIDALEGEVTGIADLSYEIEIPGDLLGEMQSRTIAEIMMTAEDGQVSVTETMQITIVKENNGFIFIPEPKLQDFTYTMENIDLSSDPDGINPLPEVAYQWQRELLGEWLDIENASNQSYTVGGIVGESYRVLLDYTDKQGYRHRSLASPETPAPPQLIYSETEAASISVTDTDTVDLNSIFIHIKVFPEGLLK